MKAIEIISRFVIERLPDSLTERKELLAALLQIAGHTGKGTEIFRMLTLLQRHEELQREFSFGGNPQHDGDGKGSR